MDVAPPPVSSSSVADALTPRQIGLILFALTLGGFAIGTSEFASMGLMPNMVASLGVTEPQVLNVATLSGELAPGSQLLLCSDGLTEEVDDQGISRVLAHTECSAQECVDGLVAAALDGGGSDNVTVVLVRSH